MGLETYVHWLPVCTIFCYRMGRRGVFGYDNLRKLPAGVYSLDLQLSDIAIQAGGIINYDVLWLIVLETMLISGC